MTLQLLVFKLTFFSDRPNKRTPDTSYPKTP